MRGRTWLSHSYGDGEAVGFSESEMGVFFGLGRMIMRSFCNLLIY